MPRPPTEPMPLRIRELPTGERPRERLVAHGAGALSATELLAVLWGSGGVSGSSLDVATKVIGRHGSLSELARTDVLELTSVPGVGAARAAQLLAAIEIGRRSAAWSATGRWTIRAPRDICDRLSPEMAGLEREELRVLLLNAKNVVLRQVTVYQGNVSAALVRVAELFRDAVRDPRRGRDRRPQPSVGRPRAVAGRSAPDRGGDRGRAPARHRASRPRHSGGRFIRQPARPRHCVRSPLTLDVGRRAGRYSLEVSLVRRAACFHQESLHRLQFDVLSDSNDR